VNGDLHTAIATEVAKRLGWPDPEAVGRGAALPDALEFVYVDGIGTRFLGKNLSCCTHFAGYCLHRDKSLGRIELPDRDVRFLPGVWPEIPVGMEAQEPLALLLRTPGITRSADDMTFPAGWSYAHWLEECYVTAAESHYDVDDAAREKRLGTIAGMCLHYVHDMCMPQHRRNELLAQHAETEAQASRVWKKMGEAERTVLIWDCIDKSPQWSAYYTCKGFMEQPTKQVSRWCWLRGKVVKDIIRFGLCTTAAVLKHLRPPIVVP
jgi:hypothetical protein